MKYSSRFFLYAPLALFLLLAAGVGAYWWHAAGALSSKLDALNGHEAMPGVTLRFTSKTVSGFPFNLDVVLGDVAVTVSTPHGPSSWTAQKFALHALTYGREQVLFEAAGHQLVTWTDLKGVRHAMPFEIGALHASAIAGARGLSRLDIDMDGFASPALLAARAQLHLRVAPKGDAVDVFAAVDGVQLSPRLSSLFGSDVDSIKFDAHAVPGHVFEGLRAGAADWVRTVEAWRSAGGALRVDDLELSFDKLSAMGKGELSLDDGHFVSGYLDFKVAGIETLLATARRHHVQGGPDSGIAAALLARAAKAGTNESGMLGAVVGFHGGAVSVGELQATTEEPLY